METWAFQELRLSPLSEVTYSRIVSVWRERHRDSIVRHLAESVQSQTTDRALWRRMSLEAIRNLPCDIWAKDCADLLSFVLRRLHSESLK